MYKEHPARFAKEVGVGNLAEETNRHRALWLSQRGPILSSAIRA